MIYPDTSALVPLFKPDVHSTAARTAIGQAATLAISGFARAELTAAIAASVRNRELPADRLDMLLSRIDAWIAASSRPLATGSADVDAATLLVRRVDLRLRLPDAIHLTICRRIGATLLTFDTVQAAAATALGISLAG